MAVQQILSVGIDIGTCTIQTVFSRLKMQNMAGYFAVPKIAIIEKETVFKGEIHKTPLIDFKTIDSEAVKNIIENDFKSANLTPKDTATGAVIITGESARKENAQSVLERLSSFAGEFVVSTAGPDLESIIAGKGSGAYQYSLDNYTTAVNIDIGGGTSNIVLFDKGETLSIGCLDIGGKQITVENNKIAYISNSAKEVIDTIGENIKLGDNLDIAKLKAVANKMAEALYKLISNNADELTDKLTTAGSTKYKATKMPDAIFFSGGVADLIYNPQYEDLKYGDLGVLLGKAIKESGLFNDFVIVEGGETIRATVVGAGSYTTSVSGSTIFYDSNLLPLKNVPVLKLNDEEYLEATKGNPIGIEKKLDWFLKETDNDNAIIALVGDGNMDYEQLKLLSFAVAKATTKVLSADKPLLVAVENDMAKVFGQTLNKETGYKRNIISIDGVKLSEGDFVDLGKPLMDGLVIPLVVKTLIFG